MPKNTHPADLYRKEPIANTISFVQNSSPAPNPINPNSQIWPWHQLGTFIALMGFVASILASVSLLLKTKYFNSLVQKTPAAPGLNGAGRWIMAAVVTAIPALTLFRFGNMGAKIPLSSVLPVLYSNITFTWAVLNGLIFILLFVIWSFASSKTSNSQSVVSYGLSTSVKSKEFKWSVVGKSALLALCTLAVPYTLLYLIFTIMKVDYRFIVVMLHPMDFTHFKVFLVYLIPAVIYFFASSLVTNTWFKPKEYRGARAAVPYITNAVIAVFGLLALNLIQYLTLFATGSVPFPDVVSSLLAIAEWQLIPLLAFASVISTFLNKKTSNIYTAVFINAALFSWYSICVNAIEFVL